MVEHFLSPFEVEVIGGIFAPGQRHHRLEVIELNVEVGTLWVELVEFVCLLHEDSLHLFRPF